MSPHIAIITLLAAAILAIAMAMVGRARAVHKVQVPATTGPEAFERVYRAHQNSIEQTVMYLPVLWVAASLGQGPYVLWLGYAWVLARLWYVLGYRAASGKRAPGFLIGLLAWLGTFLFAAWGAVSALLH